MKKAIKVTFSSESQIGKVEQSINELRLYTISLEQYLISCICTMN